MCGRYTLFTDQENREIMEIIGRVQDQIKTGEIYPTNPAQVILAGYVRIYRCITNLKKHYHKNLHCN